MKFYSADKNGIDKAEFIKTYGQSYFLGNARVVKKVFQNSCYAEKEIVRLLKEGIKKPLDVVRIMAWKMGKISHNKTDEEKKFIYHKDWATAEDFKNIKRYGYKFDIKDFAEYVSSYFTCLRENATNNPQDVLNKLNKKSVKGIGTVYLITLLYFISGGKYPIYDRFARKAIYAIKNGLEPGDSVPYSELPQKNCKEFKNVMEKAMKEYIGDLEEIFGEDYKTNRNIDRALWVYGHMFPDKK